MELKDKIINCIKSIELCDPIIEVYYDNQNNIRGYVTDSYFEKISDEVAQDIIWNSFNKILNDDELKRVLSIIHETPNEKLERLEGYTKIPSKPLNFWCHKAPKLSKYWLFVDVAKFGNEYKSFYLVINHNESFVKGLSFIYPKEIIDYMELIVQMII